MEGLIEIAVFNERDGVWEIYTHNQGLTRSKIAPTYGQNVFYYHYSGIHYSFLQLTETRRDKPISTNVIVESANNDSISYGNANDSNCLTETIYYGRIKIMLQMYKSTSPNSNYIEDVQIDNEFTPKWRYRAVLCMLSYYDIGVCDETFSLAINIFDRYLSKKAWRNIKFN